MCCVSVSFLLVPWAGSGRWQTLVLPLTRWRVWCTAAGMPVGGAWPHRRPHSTPGSPPPWWARAAPGLVPAGCTPRAPSAEHWLPPPHMPSSWRHGDTHSGVHRYYCDMYRDWTMKQTPARQCLRIHNYVCLARRPIFPDCPLHQMKECAKSELAAH